MIRMSRFSQRYAIPFAVILCLCLAFFSHPAHADMEAEIEYLLLYIESSNCTFHRNGKIHDNKDASAHIRKKYNHTKRWINSTEDFIEYAATKSSISGDPYQVICDGIQLPTATWLTEELARFRKKSQ